MMWVNFKLHMQPRVLAPMEPTMIIASDLNRARQSTAHDLVKLAELEVA